jgi:hypothetical protein
MTGFTSDVSQGTLIRTDLTQGFGIGCVFLPLSTVTFGTLAPALHTQGTGLLQPDAQYRSEHRHLDDELSLGA